MCCRFSKWHGATFCGILLQLGYGINLNRMNNDLKEAVTSTYTAVVNTLNALCLHVYDDLSDLPSWVSDQGVFTRNLDTIVYALKNFGPTPGLTPQETYSCPGAVAGTEQTIALIQQVNAAKDAFKLAVMKVKQSSSQDISIVIRSILAQSGHTAIKLKQVYRHIPYINYHPRRIAWSKGKHSSSKNLSKKEAERLVIAAGQGEHIDIQLAKLAMLDDKTRLVIHRNIKPCWVVNIATFKDGKQSRFEDLKTSLPIFYLFDFDLDLPVVCFSESNLRTVATRADRALEENPFLPSISAYRAKQF